MVRIFDEAHRFRGTGFVVSDRAVLTCTHVVAGATALSVELEAASAALDPVQQALSLPACRVPVIRVHSSPTDDATIVASELRLTRSPLALMSGVSAEILRSWSGDIAAHGFRAPLGEAVNAERLVLRGTLLADSSSATLCTGQLDGGAASGMSGSPLVVRYRGQWLAVGMLYLGGVQSGQTAFVGSDRLLATLRAAGVDASSCLAAAREGQSPASSEHGNEQDAASRAPHEASSSRPRSERAYGFGAAVLAAAALALGAARFRTQTAPVSVIAPVRTASAEPGAAPKGSPDGAPAGAGGRLDAAREPEHTPSTRVAPRDRADGASSARARAPSPRGDRQKVGAETPADPAPFPICPDLALHHIDEAGWRVFACRCHGKALMTRGLGRTEAMARQNASRDVGQCDKS